MSQRIGPGISATAAGPAGSHRWFPGGRGPSPQGGARGDRSPRREEPAESPMGGLTVREPTMRSLVRGPHVRPGAPALRSPGAALLLPGARAFPGPALLSLKPTLLSHRARPAAGSRPLLLPPLLLARAHPPRACFLRSLPLSSLSSALPRMRPGGRKRAFACGVPGALLGTWVSPTRFDEDERPVSRERLDMRGTHSHEASSWARGYYAE